MITFLVGLAVLIIGGAIYGRVWEKLMKPTDAETPATKHHDGVDFVPMGKWRNALIELLNIAGTGPILGPIQGILFGPIAFVTIPIGCIIAGGVHDYMTGMISIRNDGKQTPVLIREFLGKHMFKIYNVFVCLLLILLSVVFIYTPGDLFIANVIKGDTAPSNPVVWIVYGGIFAYYLIATMFPIDKIIGKVYPIFGAILLLSAVGVFIGIFVKGYPLTEIWESVGGFPYQGNFIPIFFVTVSCGICSGFHSTQATIVSRTVISEQHGRMTFYNMMIVEGFIAMIWAAATMGAIRLGLTNPDQITDASAQVVGVIAKDMLGTVGGIIAIVGVIVLPITSGDTALRSLRLIVGEALNIDQKNKKNALVLAFVLFSVAAAILVWAKLNPSGFNFLWRYFSWANSVLIVFTFTLIATYMKRHKLPYILAVLPGTFYMYVVTSYILNAKIGLHLPWMAAYIVAGVLTLAYAVTMMFVGREK
nr:carbon starvation protein A [Eubacterium sp.]